MSLKKILTGTCNLVVMFGLVAGTGLVALSNVGCAENEKKPAAHEEKKAEKKAEKGEKKEMKKDEKKTEAKKEEKKDDKK